MDRTLNNDLKQYEEFKNKCYAIGQYYISFNEFQNILNTFGKVEQSEEVKKINNIVLNKPVYEDSYKQWLIDSITPANSSEKAIVLSDFLKNYIKELKPEPLMMMVNPTLYNTISNLVLLNRKTSIFDKFSYKELSCDICKNKWKEQIRKDLSYWLSIGS